MQHCVNMLVHVAEYHAAFSSFSTSTVTALLETDIKNGLAQAPQTLSDCWTQDQLLYRGAPKRSLVLPNLASLCFSMLKHGKGNAWQEQRQGCFAVQTSTSC